MAFAVLHEMAEISLFGMISALVAKLRASLAGVGRFDSPELSHFRSLRQSREFTWIKFISFIYYPSPTHTISPPINPCK
jgi:hypothetical protein